uniref:Uncharacterized protein n=1 Tax=Hyaloperonospora arabidopsidis (strain Emoy2) TaxID=559515 RepID=M4B393_HYAAE
MPLIEARFINFCGSTVVSFQQKCRTAYRPIGSIISTIFRLVLRQESQGETCGGRVVHA